MHDTSQEVEQLISQVATYTATYVHIYMQFPDMEDPVGRWLVQD